MLTITNNNIRIFMALKKEFVGSIEHVHTHYTNEHIHDAKYANEKNNCTMQINVERVVNNDKEFYDVIFKYTYNGKIMTDKFRAHLHPMFYDEEFMEYDYDGNSICVNELMTTLIKYLLTPIHELHKYSGIRSCTEYHRTLLKTFSAHSLEDRIPFGIHYAKNMLLYNNIICDENRVILFFHSMNRNAELMKKIIIMWN